MTWIRVEVKGILWKAKIGIVEIMATMYVFVVVFPLSFIMNLDLAMCRAYMVLIMEASIMVMIIPLILKSQVRIGARAIMMIEFASAILRVVFVFPSPLNRLPRTNCPSPTRKNWIAYMDRKVDASS